jgi:hypothetical protein
LAEKYPKSMRKFTEIYNKMNGITSDEEKIFEEPKEEEKEEKKENDEEKKEKKDEFNPDDLMEKIDKLKDFNLDL